MSKMTVLFHLCIRAVMCSKKIDLDQEDFDFEVVGLAVFGLLQCTVELQYYRNELQYKNWHDGKSQRFFVHRGWKLGLLSHGGARIDGGNHLRNA